MPGLLLWAATALAFWKGLHEPEARRWRVLVGVLVGLAFVEKMAAVIVLVPLLAWLVVGHLPRTLVRPGALGRLGRRSVRRRPCWSRWRSPTSRSSAWRGCCRRRTDGPVPSTVPRAACRASSWPCRWPSGSFRRLLGPGLPGASDLGGRAAGAGDLDGGPGLRPGRRLAGQPRLVARDPAAAGPLLPAQHRSPRILPDIRIFYLGRTYLYSLPWHNAWVLIAITVPRDPLGRGGRRGSSRCVAVRRDRLPFYFLLHFATLPACPDAADPGARRRPAASCRRSSSWPRLAGWGAAGWPTAWRGWSASAPIWPARRVAALVLGPAAWQLVEVHPFELSYYNELIGGPRGAWESGFELSYWYDAFNPRTLAEINARLPRGAAVDFLNEKTNPTTFQELQSLGELRGDLVLGDAAGPRQFPYVWLLTQDSKATAFTRLLFAMAPWYARRPRQLGRPAGRDGGRSRGGLKGLGSVPAGQRSGRRRGRPPRSARLGPTPLLPARPLLGRGPGPGPPPRCQHRAVRLGAGRPRRAPRRRPRDRRPPAARRRSERPTAPGYPRPLRPARQARRSTLGAAPPLPARCAGRGRRDRDRPPRRRPGRAHARALHRPRVNRRLPRRPRPSGYSSRIASKMSLVGPAVGTKVLMTSIWAGPSRPSSSGTRWSQCRATPICSRKRGGC